MAAESEWEVVAVVVVAVVAVVVDARARQQRIQDLVAMSVEGGLQTPAILDQVACGRYVGRFIRSGCVTRVGIGGDERAMEEDEGGVECVQASELVGKHKRITRLQHQSRSRVSASMTRLTTSRS